MKSSILTSIFIYIFSFAFSQNDPHISKPIPTFINNILTVKYDITGCGSNEYVDITIILINSKGDTLMPRYITGDIGKMVSCGLGKRIDWNLGNDNLAIDEDVQIILKGIKAMPALPEIDISGPKKTSRGNVILSSMFIPGLGQKKASGKQAHLITGGLVYGCLVPTLYFSIKSSDYKVKYNLATGTYRDDMFDKWQKNYTLAKVFGVGTASVWVANIVWASLIPIETLPRKDLKVSFSKPYQEPFLISVIWKF